MGKAKSLRRRAKNAERANHGNLHKAARGKAGASVHLPLPSAPTKDDYMDRMPASLRKMLALKEAAAHPAKRRKVGAAQEQQQQEAAQLPDGRRAQQQQQQQGGHAAGVGRQGHNHAAAAAAGPESQQQQQQQQAPAALLWQQPKKLKQRKKEYLNAKRKKKKQGAKGDGDAEELQLRAQQPAPFGEVAHAPPRVAQQWQHRKQPGSGSNHGDAERQDVRGKVIEGYRAARPMPREGQATLQSLKQLVRASSSTG